MVEMKIPGMAYTVRLVQKAPDNIEVVILLHGTPEASARTRLLEKGPVRRAIATGLRQIGVTVHELSLETIARRLVEAVEEEGFPSEIEQPVSTDSLFEDFKELTNERIVSLEAKLEELVARVARIEERLRL